LNDTFFFSAPQLKRNPLGGAYDMRLAAWLMLLFAITLLVGAYLVWIAEPEFGFGAIAALVLGLLGFSALVVSALMLGWLRRHKDPVEPPRAA
jgi:hypothetical protein